MKVLIVLLCMGGGMFVLCCGGVIYIFSSVAKGVSNSPEDARRITQEIVEMDVPDRYTPMQSFEIEKIPFLPFIPSTKGAIYQGGEQNILMIFEIDIPAEDLGPDGTEEMRRAIEQQQGAQSLPQIEVDEQETEIRQYEIQGEQVDVIFAKGIDPETQQAMRQVTAVFSSENGVVMILLVATEEFYDEDEIDTMFKSMK
ncbi:MAG: hypothetical protein IID46_00645 [Planctomycetes bacterium]|nr:hypothetical protein [Planctomycetota bacterium]